MPGSDEVAWARIAASRSCTADAQSDSPTASCRSRGLGPGLAALCLMARRRSPRPRCSRTTRPAAPSSTCASAWRRSVSRRSGRPRICAARTGRQQPDAPQPAGAADADRDRCAARSRACTGQNEQLLRDIWPRCSGGRRTWPKGVDERLRKVEPSQVRSTAANSSPTRTRRASSRPRWPSSAKAISPPRRPPSPQFIQRYPQSGFRPTALFWLGNSQYANRDYRGAIANFRALLAGAPTHPRAAGGGAVDRQLPDRAEGHRRRAPHARRTGQGLSAVRGGRGRTRAAGAAALSARAGSPGA